MLWLINCCQKWVSVDQYQITVSQLVEVKRALKLSEDKLLDLNNIDCRLRSIFLSEGIQFAICL